jgi:DNA anti-recombination protein RmuC
MPTSLPPSVRESWGEQVADDFSQWLDKTLQERTVHRDEYREVLSRLDVLEERLEQMEARFDERFEQIDQRFEQIDQRFESMEERFNERFDGMQNRFDGMRKRVDDRFEGMDAKLDRMNDRILSMTRWLIGLVALFGTLVTVLLAVAQFGS